MQVIAGSSMYLARDNCEFLVPLKRTRSTNVVDIEIINSTLVYNAINQMIIQSNLV